MSDCGGGVGDGGSLEMYIAGQILFAQEKRIENHRTKKRIHNKSVANDNFPTQKQRISCP